MNMSADKTQHGKGFTFVNAGTIVQGELLVENDLAIEGTVKGTIRATGNVTINVHGKVEGEIQAASATIGGTMNGNVTVSDKVTLESMATLVGDLKTKELVIQEGAHFHGNCSMQPGNKAKE
jgi:cytoskeletal protein CcmA (bactofilin family)